MLVLAIRECAFLVLSLRGIFALVLALGEGMFLVLSLGSVIALILFLWNCVLLVLSLGGISSLILALGKYAFLVLSLSSIFPLVLAFGENALRVLTFGKVLCLVFTLSRIISLLVFFLWEGPILVLSFWESALLNIFLKCLLRIIGMLVGTFALLSISFLRTKFVAFLIGTIVVGLLCLERRGGGHVAEHIIKFGIIL